MKHGIMFEEMTFTVVSIDGTYLTVDQFNEPSIRMEGLSWEEATELLRISLAQGFQVVIWAEVEDEVE